MENLIGLRSGLYRGGPSPLLRPQPYNLYVLRKLSRPALAAILLGIALIVLPNAWLRNLNPFHGEWPTATPLPTADLAGDAYARGLQLAASDPLAALPLFEEVMFTDHPQAAHARTLARAIQGARVQDDPAYLFTASGRALAAVGEWSLARAALLQAVQADPDYAEAWAYLGEAQYQNGVDSREELQHALELNPNSVAVQLFNALYWQRHEDYEQADLHFYVATQLDPANVSILVQWGQASMLAGDPLAARQHFEDAATLSPDDPQIWKTLARYSLDSGLYVEELGLEAAVHLLDGGVEDAETLVLLGRAQIALGHRTAGRGFLERALALDPTYAPAALQLGLFYLAEEDLDTAFDYFDQVIAMAPGSPEAELASQLIVEYTQ